MSPQQAQQIINDMNAHKIIWDDNLRAQANNILNSQSTSGNSSLDPLAIAKAQQQAQIEANKPAIATMQTASSNLADQYKNLLASVTAQGNATYNTAVSGENAYLGARGLLSEAGVGNTQLSQAENTVNTSNAANQANIQTGAANTQADIAKQIASLQAGNLPQAENFAQNIYNTQAGITNTNTTANEALQAAKLNASEPFNTAGQVFNPSTLRFASNTGGGGDMSDMTALAKKIVASRGNKRSPAQSISQYVHSS